jgi:putative MATE family efflux protein
LAQIDLTRGPIPRQLRALWLPALGAMLMQSIYAFVDLIFVTRLGDRAVAALGITLQAFFIILALGQMVGTTSLADISQAYGRDDVPRARRLFTFYTLVALALGTVASLAAFGGADAYVGAFSDDPEVRALGAEYFAANAPTFLLQLLIIVFAGAVRASGDFMTPMRIMIASVLVNGLLDPVLMFGWGPIPAMGIAGAGWATVIAQSVSVLAYALRFLARSGGPRALTWARPTFVADAFVRIFTRGFPAGLQFFSIYLIVGVVLAGVKPSGADWTGAAGGGFRILQQTWLPLVTLGMAAGTIAGQNVGARNPDRVRAASWTAMRWGLLYGAAGFVLVLVLAPWLAWLGAEGEGQHAVVTDYLRISAPMLLSFSLTYIPTFVLQAAGHTMAPMLAAFVRVAALAAVVLLLLPALEAPPIWVFVAASAASFIEAALGLWLLTRFLAGLDPAPGAQPEAQPEAQVVSAVIGPDA